MLGQETIWHFIDRKVETLREQRRKPTAKNYKVAANSLLHFLESIGWDQDAIENMSFSLIDEDFVCRYNDYLQSSGIISATVSFYNRTLRSIYNQAVREGLVKNAHPFDEVYTKVVPKLTPRSIDTVKSDKGEIIQLDTLSRDELVKRYKKLQTRYNTLVNKLSAIVGA